MSKSVGNIRTLRSILDRHRPEALITAFLSSHYRSPLEFSEDLLEETEQQVDRLRNVFGGLADAAPAGAGRRAGPRARRSAASPSPTTDSRSLLDQAWLMPLAAGLRRGSGRRPQHRRGPGRGVRVAREVNAALAAAKERPRRPAAVRAEMAGMVHVLGLDAVTGGDDAIPADVIAMAEERRAARAARDFARADALRNARSPNAATKSATYPMASRVVRDQVSGARRASAPRRSAGPRAARAGAARGRRAPGPGARSPHRMVGAPPAAPTPPGTARCRAYGALRRVHRGAFQPPSSTAATRCARRCGAGGSVHAVWLAAGRPGDDLAAGSRRARAAVREGGRAGVARRKCGHASPHATHRAGGQPRPSGHRRGGRPVPVCGARGASCGTSRCWWRSTRCRTRTTWAPSSARRKGRGPA